MGLGGASLQAWLRAFFQLVFALVQEQGVRPQGPCHPTQPGHLGVPRAGPLG